MKKALKATQHTIELEGEHLPIVVRRHRTSRRIVIRYQPLYHRLSLTLPRYATLKQGLRFVEEKRGWIEREIQNHPRRQPFADGEIISVLGKTYTLRHIGGRGLVQIEDESVLVPGDVQFMARRVRDWLKKMAAAEIEKLACEKAATLQTKAAKIALRDTSSHWGSCSADGNLSFSWRLVFAPYDVLDYVVSHEAAHLKYLDHSPAFWRQVEAICPHWREGRKWLKTNGRTLYLYH